jgi:transcriptional regulator with XRE-family HTH domain
VRLRPHPESKPPSHPGGGESRPNPNRQKLLGQALSELLNIDYDNLAAYEAGVERINAKLLFQTAKLLDVRPDYFFRGYTTEDWKAA